MSIEAVRRSTMELYDSIVKSIKLSTLISSNNSVEGFMRMDREHCDKTNTTNLYYLLSTAHTIATFEARVEYWKEWCKEYLPDFYNKKWPLPPVPPVKPERMSLVEFEE